MEIHPAEMSRGENDHEKVLQQLVIDQTETSQGDIDHQEFQCLGAKLVDGPQKTKFFFSSPCIYRVPNERRKLKASAYTPHLIAIGPLHRDDPHLQTTIQHVKLSYANNLLCRLTEGMEDLELAEQKKFTVLRECMVAIKTPLDDAKKCYPEEVTLNVEMMLVDGCFILEFLYRFYWGAIGRNSEGGDPADPIFGYDSTLFTIQHDLLLLENQIPFLVLERLFPLTLARIPNRLNKNLSLTDYVFLPIVDRLMRPHPKGNSRSTENSSPYSNAKRYNHILHKLHDDYLPPSDQTGKGEQRHTEELPSASELHYAGIKFVCGTGDDLFKVEFTEPQGLSWLCRRARFEIPYLVIDDSTESVLRNLIAFEQCCPAGTSQHFTSYAKLMDMLVNYDKDVQVLIKAGIVRNCLGASNDVTNLFNKLSKEIGYEKFFFADTCNKAISYRKQFWPKNMIRLRRQYFASPWKCIAFCLGLVYFCITIAQFILNFLREERYRY